MSTPHGARAADHDEDRRVRRHRGRRRAAWRRCCAARVESVEPIAGSKNVKAVVDAGRYGQETVVCGAPNCRAGMVTAYVPAHARAARFEGISAASRATACWPAARTRHQSRSRRASSNSTLKPGDPLPLHARSASSRSTTSRITHRPDLWGHHGMAREVAAILRKPLRDPVKLDLLPAGRRRDRGRDRRFRSVPAVQRAGVRERHGAAVAAVAAIPARRRSG